jgi:hypothetical protein
MRRQHYRMRVPTVAVSIHDGQKVMVTIPEGGEIEVVGGPLDSDGFLDVSWEGKSVRMFGIDIRERGERLDAGRSLTA